jgi:hypothetical protein
MILMSPRGTVCSSDDRSEYCQSQKFMFYLKSIVLIIILFYLVYNKYRTGSFF